MTQPAQNPVVDHLISSALMLLAGASLQQPAGSGVVAGVVYAQGVSMENAVVYLVSTPETSSPPEEQRVVVDQVNLRFVPSILVVRPGAVVEFRNSDPILHNVFSPGRSGDGFNLGTYPRHLSKYHTFYQPGIRVILCHVHPEMAAYIIVAPTRYHTLAQRNGRFRIEGVPPGRYTLRVWHRRTRPLEKSVVVGSNRAVKLELELKRR